MDKVVYIHNPADNSLCMRHRLHTNTQQTIPEIARLRCALEYSRVRLQRSPDNADVLRRHILYCYHTYMKLRKLEVVR